MDLRESSARKRYVFGNYEIIETTGAGGMGIVYRAMDRSLGRIVALKVLRDDLRSQGHLVARFQREAEAFATLDHPNIVEIYSVGRMGGIPYIAMEFVHGDPLSEVLRQRAPMPWKESLDIGLQVADALACAHDAGIIHRDIKPANILIDSEGKSYVTDFGIAKVLNAAQKLTVEGARLGTPQYMSPERCKNQEVTPSSDIYSLGVLLFQCITGRLPYEAHDAVELIRKITGEEPSRLRDFLPEAPVDVERLIAYMIEPKPDDRPGDARVLCAAIERVRAGLPLDERADELAGAIASYRRGLSTPTPSGSSTPHVLAEESPSEKVAAAWFALPRALRLIVALSLPLAAVAIALASLAPLLMAGPPGTLDWGHDGGLGRWRQNQPLARFVEETPGVTRVLLQLPNFAVSDLDWGGEGTGVIATLDGRERSDRQGQRMLCRVQPRLERAGFLLSPIPIADAGDFRVLTGSSDQGGTAGYYVSAPAGTHFVQSLSDARGFRVGSEAASMAFATSGAVFARETNDGRYALVEEALSGGTSQEIIHHVCDGVIDAVACDNAGGRIAFAVADAAGQPGGLYLLQAGLRGEARCVLPGSVSLGGHPFDATGDRVVVSRRGGDGDPALIVIETATGNRITELGPGGCASWHPTAGYLLATDSDRLGRTQVYAVESDGPHRRKQLTHLESGTLNQVCVVPDGTYAVTAQQQQRDAQTDPAVVVVDLPTRLF